MPYLFTWKNVLAVSAFLGGIQVFITIFLEPHGTGEYVAPYRNLRLAGYATCFIFPFLLFYGLERWIYNLQHQKWAIWQEVVSKTLIIVSIATASYFYNITVVNSISPSLTRWADHMIIFAWPYIPLFIPFMVIIYMILYRRHEPEVHKLTINGQNKGDKLTIPESDFIFAESDQNYVTIVYLAGDEKPEQQLIRSSLRAVHVQVPFAKRIHRSYLINPLHLKSVEGNKRKQSAIMNFVEKPLPVSTEWDKEELLKSSD